MMMGLDVCMLNPLLDCFDHCVGVQGASFLEVDRPSHHGQAQSPFAPRKAERQVGQVLLLSIEIALVSLMSKTYATSRSVGCIRFAVLIVFWPLVRKGHFLPFRRLLGGHMERCRRRE